MTHAPRALTVNTRLSWSEDQGCVVEGAEGAQLSFATRRAGDDPAGNGQAESLLLAALETAIFRSFLSYAHSRCIDVRRYVSHAEATLSLGGTGCPRFTELAVHPEVVVATPEDEAASRALFSELLERCPVASALGTLVRLQPRIRVSAVAGELQRSREVPGGERRAMRPRP